MALKGSVEFLVARKGTHQISMACREFARNGFHPLLLYLKQNPNPSHKTKSHRRPNMLVKDSNTHTLYYYYYKTHPATLPQSQIPNPSQVLQQKPQIHRPNTTQQQHQTINKSPLHATNYQRHKNQPPHIYKDQSQEQRARSKQSKAKPPH